MAYPAAIEEDIDVTEVAESLLCCTESWGVGNGAEEYRP